MNKRIINIRKRETVVPAFVLIFALFAGCTPVMAKYRPVHNEQVNGSNPVKKTGTTIDIVCGSDKSGFVDSSMLIKQSFDEYTTLSTSHVSKENLSPPYTYMYLNAKVDFNLINREQIIDVGSTCKSDYFLVYWPEPSVIEKDNTKKMTKYYYTVYRIRDLQVIDKGEVKVSWMNKDVQGVVYFNKKVKQQQEDPVQMHKLAFDEMAIKVDCKIKGNN